MTQPTLIPLSTLDQDHRLQLSDGSVFTPRGLTAYAADHQKVGMVRDALVDPTSGKLQYLMVDVGGWFSTKQVLVPVGQARLTEDGAYFDRLTKDQVRDLSEYYVDQVYTPEHQQADERVLRSAGVDEATYRREAFQTPETLKLLEERLTIYKERFIAGTVHIGKRVETHQEQVEVPLQREEVFIERRVRTEARPASGVIFGEEQMLVQVELQAERVQVSKQAYVVEEVTVGKRQVTDTQTVTETIGKEVLDVTQSGNVRVSEGDPALLDR